MEGAVLVNRDTHCKVCTFCRELCNNDGTDRFAVLIVDSSYVGRRMLKLNRIDKVAPICPTTIFRDMYRNG